MKKLWACMSHYKSLKIHIYSYSVLLFSFGLAIVLWVRISIRARSTTLCDKVGQWLATGRLYSPITPVSFTNKTERHDITETLLNVALNTITLKPGSNKTEGDVLKYSEGASTINWMEAKCCVYTRWQRLRQNHNVIHVCTHAKFMW